MSKFIDTVMLARLVQCAKSARLGLLCMILYLNFAPPSALAAAPQAGVQTPLLRPGKSQLVRQLEALLYDDDFCVIPERSFNAVDFGAVADGKTLNTEAIQKAIDAANAAGGDGSPSTPASMSPARCS